MDLVGHRQKDSFFWIIVLGIITGSVVIVIIIAVVVIPICLIIFGGMQSCWRVIDRRVNLILKVLANVVARLE